MWDFLHQGQPVKELGVLHDKIMHMAPDHFVYYSRENAEQRPGVAKRSAASIETPW
jgi:hypothetical protein